MENKLIFRCGVVGSGKSADLLSWQYKYESAGYGVIVLKSILDTRDNINNQQIVKSRFCNGYREAITIKEDDDIGYLFLQLCSFPNSHKTDVIMIDEVQFFTEEQVDQLRKLVDNNFVTVICYGLKTDSHCHLFPASKRLLEIADTVEELPSLCRCGKTAVVSARLGFGNKVVTDGPLFQPGYNYQPMCYRCWQDEIYKLRYKENDV